MGLSNLETPCLLLNAEVTQRNIDRMAERYGQLAVPLRPHVKTAKSIDVVRRMLERQTSGIAVSTLNEAEYFFSHGVKDILYAVGIAPNKMPHVAALRCRGADLTVILDSVEQAELLAEAGREAGTVFPALIEVDTDGHRSGVQPGDPVLLEIGTRLHGNDYTELSGVMAHGGESYACGSIEEIAAIARQERDRSVASATKLRDNDLPCPVVSIGSTPTACTFDSLDGVTEVRTGVYVFNDLTISGLGVCSTDDIALSVLTSVIGHQKHKNWIITDSGWTSLSADRSTASMAVDQGFGLVCDVEGRPLDDLIVSGTNQEHGIVSRRDGGAIDSSRYPVGTLFRVLPNHACATGTAHSHYTVVDGLEVIGEWPRINGW